MQTTAPAPVSQSAEQLGIGLSAVSFLMDPF